jgi:hypothetical protein
VKVRTLQQVNERARDGRVFSAGQGAVWDVDDADTDMVDLARSMAARQLAEILGAEAEPEAEPEAGGEQSENAEVAEEVEAEAEAEPAPVIHTDYEDRTIVELREVARSRNLPVSGSKDDLIARLRGAE